MNKTININLGGFFFHIDETAYQKLKRYLDSIARSLSDDPQGKNEIISDIEARISELLSERITDARQVVNENDIEEVIAIMGQPEDYAEAEESYAESNYSYQRRSSNSKKLFRDGDDKFLGGVCSGIGHYFNVDVIWIRIAFILLIASGFSPLAYIILWILLPEAKTTAEKLQMEGEAVNIDNIEKKIREEFSNVSENVRNVANQASDKIKDGAQEITEKVNSTFKRKKNNNGFQDFLDALGKIIMAFFKVVGKFIGVILIIISSAVLISLIISLFSVGSMEFLSIDSDFVHLPAFFYDSTLPVWLLTTFGCLLVGIPFLILFVLGLRILSSNVKQFSKVTSLTLLGIWLVALLAIIFTSIEFASTKAYDGNKIVNSTLDFQEKDTIKLKLVNDDNIYYLHNLRRNTSRQEVTINGVDKIYSNNIKLKVLESDDNQFSIKIRKSSEGRNITRANNNASDIEYNYNINDDTLVLDAYFLSKYKHIFKYERIYVTIYVPKGKTVYFDYSTRNFLHGNYDVDNMYDSEMADHYFLMTEKGLKCADCKEEKEDEEMDNEEENNNDNNSEEPEF